jgi:hypothetical protein
MRSLRGLSEAIMRRDRFFGNAGPRYLRAADITAQSITYTIAACREEHVGKDREPKPVLYFEEQRRGLVLNITNWDTLAELFGEESDGWVGQQVTLFTTTGDYKGKTWVGIRLRKTEDDSAAPF